MKLNKNMPCFFVIRLSHFIPSKISEAKNVPFQLDEELRETEKKSQQAQDDLQKSMVDLEQAKKDLEGKDAKVHEVCPFVFFGCMYTRRPPPPHYQTVAPDLT